MNHVEPIEVGLPSCPPSATWSRTGLTRKRVQITKRVINGVYNGVTTVELDNLAAETAAYMTTRHPVCFHVSA